MVCQFDRLLVWWDQREGKMNHMTVGGAQIDRPMGWKNGKSDGVVEQ